METKDAHLKIKSLDEAGEFTGLGSIYSDEDMVGDIIQRGAFASAIAHQGRGYPLLFAHKQDEPIGIGRIEDSAPGLVVHGQLLMEDPAAKRVHAHLKAGSLKGLSIGFTIPRTKSSYRDDGVRVIKEIHLHEISVVAVPAAPKALVTSVKSLSDARALITRMQATDLDDGMLDELREIDRQLKSLLAGHPEPQAVQENILADLKALAADLAQRA